MAGKIITISSVKGGVGKTTMTLNLAGIYCELNKRVLIIDLDLYSGGIAASLNVKNKKDIYYTPNTFNSPIKREREYLWQLHRFYIDIDHKAGTEPIDPFEVVGAVEQLVEEKKIPQPTEYINSGRGIHIYWDINNCHIMLLDLWEKIENHLFNTIKELERSIKNKLPMAERLFFQPF